MRQKNNNSFLNKKSKAQHVLELALIMPLLIICFCFVFQMMVETYAKYKFSYAFTNATRQLLRNRPVYNSLEELNNDMNTVPAEGADADAGGNNQSELQRQQAYAMSRIKDFLTSEVIGANKSDGDKRFFSSVKLDLIESKSGNMIYIVGAYQLVNQTLFGQSGSEYFYYFVPINKVYTEPLVLNYSENDVKSYFDFYYSTFSERFYEQAGEQAAQEDAAAAAEEETGDGTNTGDSGTDTGSTTEGDTSSGSGTDSGTDTGSTTDGGADTGGTGGTSGAAGGDSGGISGSMQG